MNSKEYIEWCKINGLDSSLVSSFYEYQNEIEYLDYLNSLEN